MAGVVSKGGRKIHSWDSNSIILLVDDDPVCRLFCRQNLARTGRPVIEAENGKQAVRLALRHRPGIIVIDVNLPDISACQALQRLRNGWPSAPAESRVVGMSADHSKQIEHDILQAGCQQVLFKPFAAENLMSAIGYRIDLPSCPTRADLRCSFLLELPQQLRDLDSAISRLQWHRARRILHQFGGAASFAGFGQMAGLARVLRRHITDPDDCASVAESYLALLQCASEMLNQGPLTSAK